MKAQDRFKKLLAKYRDDPEYLTEGLLLNINEQLLKQLEQRGITQTAFAKMLGVSNAYISKLLNGNENLTLKQLVRIAHTLECNVDVALVPKTFSVNRLFSYTQTALETHGYNQKLSLDIEAHEPDIPVAA
jgi:transcriptional regulator with XRE-family HTH domain